MSIEGTHPHDWIVVRRLTAHQRQVVADYVRCQNDELAHLLIAMRRVLLHAPLSSDALAAIETEVAAHASEIDTTYEFVNEEVTITRLVMRARR